jgi:hypothetical protein
MAAMGRYGPLGSEPLAVLVTRGLAMVEQRLAAAGGAAPVHLSLRAQLRYVRGLLETDTRPTPEDLDRLTMGVYAAREFEASDPDLAEVLFGIEYQAKRL